MDEDTSPRTEETPVDQGRVSTMAVPGSEQPAADTLDATPAPGTEQSSPATRAQTTRPQRRQGIPLWMAALVGFLVVGLAVGGFALGRVSAPEQEAAPATTAAPTTTVPAVTGTTTAIDPNAEPVAAVAEALGPSVVQIETDLGLGSGVIYDASGLILTAAHVVGNTQQVIVQLADGTRVDGTVVGADTVDDVAVVRISAPGLVVAPLALDEDIRVGQMAIAIGSPFGLEDTVTAGVVSSALRSVVGPDGSVRQLIQTDAPINPGNSGGALADRQGRVIGINDQIVTNSGGNEGVGFAIPITRAKDIADRLVAGQPIQIAFLGVTGTDPTLGEAGALITEVSPGSPAEAAGFASGDLIVAVDDTPITSFTDLAGVVRSRLPGDTVTLSVHRDGQEIELTATLASR